MVALGGGYLYFNWFPVRFSSHLEGVGGRRRMRSKVSVFWGRHALEVSRVYVPSDARAVYLKSEALMFFLMDQVDRKREPQI